MATNSNSDILRIAREAVPEHIRPLGRVVQQAPQVALTLAGKPKPVGAAKPDTLIADLAKHVGAKLPKSAADVAVVEFPEQTALGLRTTVVHVKNGKVARVIKRG
ncbi:hypothetical protein ACFJGW_12525 [Burkholderiaceae bacterium UC74_6]